MGNNPKFDMQFLHDRQHISLIQDCMMKMKISPTSDRFCLFLSTIGFSIIYLNLIWKSTGSIDSLVTDGLFWGAILYLLWRKQQRLNYQSDIVSSFLGFCLIGIILFKLVSLFWFESVVISLSPICFAIALALIASGVRGLWQYWQELFFSLFLFFPTEAIGHFIDNSIELTGLTAKFSTYVLYYIGFNVANHGREVILFLPNIGSFKAVVNYPCAGVPMILLMLKLALLLISFFPFSKTESIVIPAIATGLGFILGVIRVCILTLAIPNPPRFDYWHGDSGSQIFSTIGMMIFAIFCHWMLKQQELKQQLAPNLTPLSGMESDKISDSDSSSIPVNSPKL
jgi:cyanoexosortase A